VAAGRGLFSQRGSAQSERFSEFASIPQFPWTVADSGSSFVTVDIFEVREREPRSPTSPVENMYGASVWSCVGFETAVTLSDRSAPSV